MNFTLKPSLKRRALVKITIALWNLRDIRDLLARSSTRYSNLSNIFYAGVLKVVEDKVIERVPKLPLPESLKKEVLELIQPIGLEIMKCKFYLVDKSCLGIQLPAELSWTPQGTVEQKKTAELLIKDESIDIISRYRLACLFCLEDEVRKLWNSVPQNKKEDFYNEGHPKFFNEGHPEEQHLLVVFWTYVIKGELNKFKDGLEEIVERDMSLYQFAFEYSFHYDYKAAMEYFWQKLTPREIDESLARIAGSAEHRHRDFIISDVGKLLDLNYEVSHFILSQMNEEQQAKEFKVCPAGVLACLLEWPWQSLFMEAANRVWDFLSKHHYELLLRVIVNKIIFGFKDCNYRKLFGEFWQKSPNTFKKYVIRGNLILLEELFYIEDKDNVRLIIKNATVNEREAIIFHYEGKNICERLIYDNKWDLLKFFVQECISSEDMMITFKEELKTYIINLHSEKRSETEIDIWMKFLDNIIHEDNDKI